MSSENVDVHFIQCRRTGVENAIYEQFASTSPTSVWWVSVVTVSLLLLETYGRQEPTQHQKTAPGRKEDPPVPWGRMRGNVRKVPKQHFSSNRLRVDGAIRTGTSCFLPV